MRIKRKSCRKKSEDMRRNISLNLKQKFSFDRTKKKKMEKFDSFISDGEPQSFISLERLTFNETDIQEHINNTVDSRSTTTGSSYCGSQISIMAFESDDEELSNDHDKAFSSLNQLLLPENAVHLSVFLNFTLVHSHPEQIFFVLITDLYKRGSLKDMRKWAYEIFSSFLIQDAPLQIFPDNIQEFISSEIEAKLEKIENFKPESASSPMFSGDMKLRDIFNKAKVEAVKIVNTQLENFQEKRKAGLDSMYGYGSIGRSNPMKFFKKDSAHKIIEKNLMPKMLRMLEEVDDDKENNDHHKLLISALSTVFHQTFKPNKGYFEPIDQFVSSGSGKIEATNVKGHHLEAKVCHSTTYCDYCLQIMFGIAPQGFECACGIKVHESCIKSLKGTCIMAQSSVNTSRDSIRLYEFVKGHLGNQRLENYKRCKANRAKSDPGVYNKFDSSSDDSEGGSHWISNCFTEVKLTDVQQKRREILIELFETEHRHNKILKVLHDVFLEPLKRSHFITAELANQLFPVSFFTIKDWHMSFEAIMEKEFRQHHAIEVGNCFTIFDEPLANILKENAAKFCAGLKDALESLREQRAKNKSLQRGIIEAESRKKCHRLQFKDFLLSILQRLAKYPLLLERLNKYCDGENSEKVTKALESSKAILQFVNMAVRNSDELREIEKNLTVDKDVLAQHGHIKFSDYKLIYDGYLTIKAGATPLRVLLFQQILVFLLKNDEKYLLRSCESIKFPILKTHNAFVRFNGADKSNRSFYLFIKMEEDFQMVEMIAKNEEECREWMTKIGDAVEVAKKNQQKRTISKEAQKVLRSDSRGKADMLKPVDLAAIGQALIEQSKQVEECFQNSQKYLRNSEQCNVDGFSTALNTLNRLVSQLTIKIAERDHERDFYLKEIRKLKDNNQ